LTDPQVLLTADEYESRAMLIRRALEVGEFEEAVAHTTLSERRPCWEMEV